MRPDIIYSALSDDVVLLYITIKLLICKSSCTFQLPWVGGNQDGWGMDFIMAHCSPSLERVCYILCGYHLTFEEKAAFAELLVLKIESVFICAGLKGRKGEGLQHHSSLLSTRQKRAEMLFSSAVHSAWFQAVTELGGVIFPFRSRVEKKENQKVTKDW